MVKNKKKFQRLLKKFEKDPSLSEHERFLFARSLAATPQERWDMHNNFLRSLNLYSYYERKKYGFK